MTEDSKLIHYQRLRYLGLLPNIVLLPFIVIFFKRKEAGFAYFFIGLLILIIIRRSVYTKYFQDRMVIYRPLLAGWTKEILYQDIVQMKIVSGHYKQPMQLKVEYINAKRKKKSVWVPAPNSPDFEVIKEYWSSSRTS